MDRVPSRIIVTDSVRSIVPLAFAYGDYVTQHCSTDSHTAKAKRYDIQKLFDFASLRLGALMTLTLADITHEFAADFREHRAASEKPSTVNRRLATHKHAGKYFETRYLGYSSPWRELKDLAFDRDQFKALLPDERDSFLSSTMWGGSAWEQSLHMVASELLFATGIRVSELCALTIGQLSPELDKFSNVRCKGARVRDVYLPSAVRPALTAYVIDRDSKLVAWPKFRQIPVDKLSALPVLLSFYRAEPARPETFRFWPRTIQRWFERTAKIAGVKHTSPHMARHTRAFDLYDATKDIELVRRANGHQSINTTLRYSLRNNDQVRDAQERVPFKRRKS